MVTSWSASGMPPMVLSVPSRQVRSGTWTTKGTWLRQALLPGMRGWVVRARVFDVAYTPFT